MTACDILLVEDNEINRVVAREMLEAAGHRVHEAHNGQIAVDMAQDQKFDLIFMDISMPVLDGRKATRAIRTGDGACANAPIIALTANAMAEEQEAFLSDGMNDILTKPLTREGLIQIITKHQYAPHPMRRASDGVKISVDERNVDEIYVDQSYMDSLRETLGVDRLAALLERYTAEVEATIKALQARGALPLEEIAERAHQIAGSSATLGAQAFRSALLSVELAAKAGETAALDQEISRLPEIWDSTRAQLAES